MITCRIFGSFGERIPLRRFVQLLAWCFQFVDYAWFVFFVLLKLYLFGKLAGLIFPHMDMVRATAGSVLLASFWTAALQRYPRFVVLWALNLAISFVIFADLVYFRYFGDFITVPVMLQAGQVGALGGSIASLIDGRDVLFFLDVLLAAPLVVLLYRPLRAGHRLRQSAKLGTRIALAALAGIIGFLLVYQPIKAYTDKYGKNLFINNWWNVAVYNVTGLLGFHYFDVKKFVDDRLNQKAITPEEEAAAYDWLINHRRQLQVMDELYGSQRGHNVLLVQAEAFQNFFIGKKINGKEITPNLNRLIGEAAYFENFHHQVGQGRTADAEFIVNTSLYPLPVGAVYREYPDRTYDALPKVLKEEGYSAFVFHSYEKSFWNRHVMYERYGIDYFYGQGDFAPGERVGWDLGDESLLDQMTDILLTQPQPFYAMAVLLSSHHPFTNIPAEYIQLDVRELAGSLDGNYLHAVHYVDFAIGKLIDRLKREGLWDNTIVAIYGDHNAALEQYDKLGELLGFAADELAVTLMDHQVPLFLHMPGAERPGIHRQAVGMIDVAPTLIHLLGIPIDDKFYMGDNLFHKNGRPVAFRYGSFTDGAVFYKASLDGIFENGVCYDLAARMPADVNACRAGYEETIRQLNISDDIIVHDLLKKFKTSR